MGALHETKTSDSNSGPLFFFGSLSSNSSDIENIVLIGTKADNDPGKNYPAGFPMVSTVYSESGSGSFYGTKYQGIGINGSAYLYDISDMNNAGNASLTLGGFKVPGQITKVNSASPDWNGFVVGIAEDIDNPENNRKIFMNSYSDEFSLSFDRSQGTLSGSISAADRKGSDTAIDSLNIGGNTSNSAYLDDKAFIALLSGNNSITGVSASASSIKEKTGFLVTEKPYEEISEYVTWGYWEAAYDDPDNNSKTYHIHAPGSFFTAGSETPQSKLAELAGTAGTLTYLGDAYSVKIDASGDMFSQTKGIFHVQADLSTYDFTGFIKPDALNQSVSLNINGNVSMSGDITGGFTNASGQINGGFFGPEADSIAGNYNALQSGNNYYGIFIGNRQ